MENSCPSYEFLVNVKFMSDSPRGSLVAVPALSL